MIRTRAVSPTADGVVPWPEEEARRYVERGWWRGRPLGAEVTAVADAHADAIALVDGDVRLT